MTSEAGNGSDEDPKHPGKILVLTNLYFVALLLKRTFGWGKGFVAVTLVALYMPYSSYAENLDQVTKSWLSPRYECKSPGRGLFRLGAERGLTVFVDSTSKSQLVREFTVRDKSGCQLTLQSVQWATSPMEVLLSFHLLDSEGTVVGKNWSGSIARFLETTLEKGRIFCRGRDRAVIRPARNGTSYAICVDSVLKQAIRKSAIIQFTVVLEGGSSRTASLYAMEGKLRGIQIHWNDRLIFESDFSDGGESGHE